jgi:hypothetical protein
MNDDLIGRREMLRRAMLAAGALVAHPLLGSATAPADDRARLASWVRTLRAERLTTQRVPLGRAVARVGELSLGSPYVAGMLDAYAREGGDPRSEPLTLDLSRFDCVLLVEGCLAVARAAHGQGRWSDFAREVERMRYRGGVRNGYASRLHYFSEWIYDNARRGMLRDLGAELGGTRDERPLRFMTEHRSAYPALRDDATFQGHRRARACAGLHAPRRDPHRSDRGGAEPHPDRRRARLRHPHRRAGRHAHWVRVPRPAG